MQETNEQQEQGQENYARLKGWLKNEDIRKRIANTLGEGFNPEAWIEAAIVMVDRTRNLKLADPRSSLGALLMAASLKLRLEGALGQAYLSAVAIKEYDRQSRQKIVVGYEAQIGIGYKGYIALAYRDPKVVDVESELVYNGDDFEFNRGDEPYLQHSWNKNTERGDLLGAFAGVRYESKYYSFRQFHISKLNEHRKKVLLDKNITIEIVDGDEIFRKAAYNQAPKVMTDWAMAHEPWIGWLDAMYQKTAIRWAAKYWKISDAFDQAASLDSLNEAGVSQQLEGFGIEATSGPAGRVVVDVKPRDEPKGSELKEPAKVSRARSKDVVANMTEEALRNRSDSASKKKESEKFDDDGMSETDKQAALELERKENSNES